MDKNTNGEFKGTVKEAIRDIRSDISEVKDDIKSLNKRYWLLLILVTVAVIERLPALVGIISAAGK